MSKVFIRANEINKQDEAIWIDTRFDLSNVEAGLELYGEGHIVNAVYWDLEKDLSNMAQAGKEGRHPMPTKAQLQQLFEFTGIAQTTPIYIYDQGGAPFATRAYWLLRYAGLNNAKIVVDGYAALVEAGFATTSEFPHPARTALTLDWQDALYVDRHYVKEVTEGQHNKVLLDARSHSRYLGENEPIDAVAGHIPTARNYDWEQLVEKGELHVNKTLENVVSKDENIIVYCGSGVSASPLFAVLDELGYDNIQLYTGSYSDWSTYYDVATGEEE